MRLGLQVAPANVTALTAFDTDGDGIADGGDADADGDGIPDIVELQGDDVAGDKNENGIPDYEDAALQQCEDANADDVCDSIPRKYDIDGDGVPNHLDLESDGDGVFDIVENGNAALDASDDGRLDDLTDLDGDGLAGVVDANDNDASIVTTQNPAVDTDGDGLIDSLDTDSDGDCVLDSDPAEAGAARIDPNVPTPGGQCPDAPDGGTSSSSSSGSSGASSSSGASGESSSSGSSGTWPPWGSPCCDARTAAEPCASRARTRLERAAPHELHESIEHPARCRAHSGRLAA